MKELTDEEIDYLVQALLLPPPYGFTEQERKQFLDYLKHPNVFLTPSYKASVREIFIYAHIVPV